MIFELTCSALSGLPNLRVAGFKGVEKLSTPYSFDIYFSVDIIPNLPLDLDLSEALFLSATLTMQLGNELPMSWSGILSSLRLVRAAETKALFHARLVPQVWQLTLTKHSRLYTKKKITDVIKEILDESDVTHELRLQTSYPVEEMITQYKESNFAFISRWMEREGMYYFFEQVDGKDVMVITDHKAVHTSLRDKPITYSPTSGEQQGSAAQFFDDFAATHNALPATIRVIDYDYARPLLDVSSTVDVEPNAVGQLSEYGGRFFSPEDAQRLAKVRAEDQLVRKQQIYATGAATQLAAGFTFNLDEHPLSQFNEKDGEPVEYLVTGISHYGYDAQYGPAWGPLVESKYSKHVYRVEVDAIVKETQFRAGQVVKWPRIDGYENAIVDGSATSEYAQLDDQGRYLIRFKFDEGSATNGKSSTWVRMAQPHGGPQEGHHFPIRKGVEVICSFLGGDPDRPVIVGVVHNTLNKSVVTNNNFTQNVIRTGSLNHIVMEDQSGAMFVEMYCPIFTSTLFLGAGEWNFNLTTEGNGQIHTEINLQFDVNAEWNVDVVSDVTWEFHSTLDWTVDSDVTIKFDACLDWAVTSDVTIKFDATCKWDVAAATTISLAATLDLSVTGEVSVEFAVDASVDIGGSLEVDIGADETQTVAGNRERNVTGNEVVNITGNQEINVSGNQKVNVTGPWHWVKEADALQLTHGVTTEIFLGLKNSLQIGAFNEMSIAFKNSLQVGVFNELTFALKNSLTFGAILELTAATKVSIAAATQLAISATNINLTGMNIAATGMEATATGPSFKVAGPEFEVAAIIIFV
jgi:type VI secretion system secreted protein VgrG